ncbi:MFS general substrate transporter [Westerdykella ornata]|uniref:MFS general substrate transporter n=1 Tax=Westerdykella ornata TaxID=318751 RepID=A0A6A6JLQ7_WESOR|nr:MFS general substrate transporter [Westerdykella ornata]KAF2277437.1 MFS general substrate transporter [Westerdykella ornata]
MSAVPQDSSAGGSVLDATSQENNKETLNSSSSSAKSSEALEAFNPGWRFYAAFASLCVITLMAALDATSLSVALPIMAKALGGSALEAFWSGTSFLLTSTVFQPIIGSFSHIFGRKPLIYVSLAFFLAGSIVAAVADNFTVILVGRSLQGVGGGGIIVMTEVVVTDLVPLRQRGKWMAMIGSMWSIGTVAGPLLGGGFSQNVSWRWIFWINLPFLGIGSIMITAFLKLNYNATSLLLKLRRVDWFGTVLFLGSITAFLIPITWGGVQYAWDSWRTLVPLLVGAAGLVLFVVHQELWAPEPLIRTAVFKDATAAVTYLESVIHGIILWGILYYLPLYYQAVKGMTPIMAGIALFPQTFTVAPASVVAGTIIAITGRYRWAIWTGWVLGTFGMGLMILLDEHTTTVEWVFLNLVGGIGTGILFPAMGLAIQASTNSADQAYAATMFSFMRAFGQTLGVAIGGVIFQNQMKKKLLTLPLLAGHADEYSKDAAGLVEIIKALPEGVMKAQLKESYVYALKYIWIVMTVLAAVAMVASAVTKAYPLDRANETEQGFVEKKKVRDSEGGVVEG